MESLSNLVLWCSNTRATPDVRISSAILGYRFANVKLSEYHLGHLEFSNGILQFLGNVLIFVVVA